MEYNEEEFIKLLESIDYFLEWGEDNTYTYKGEGLIDSEFSVDLNEYPNTERHNLNLAAFRDYNPVLNVLSLYIL